jgi:aryl-alcohol dehydrogenase-like predicted oxidoreductase
MAQTYGLAIIPWSPLAGGLLNGKYRRNEAVPPDSRFADMDSNPPAEAHAGAGLRCHRRATTCMVRKFHPPDAAHGLALPVA